MQQPNTESSVHAIAQAVPCVSTLDKAAGTGCGSVAILRMAPLVKKLNKKQRAVVPRHEIIEEVRSKLQRSSRNGEYDRVPRTCGCIRLRDCCAARRRRAPATPPWAPAA
eukprot:6197800-Pleurochrysis_carterae.AAC.1